MDFIYKQAALVDVSNAIQIANNVIQLALIAVQNALIGLDSWTIHSIQGVSRVLLVSSARNPTMLFVLVGQLSILLLLIKIALFVCPLKLVNIIQTTIVFSVGLHWDMYGEDVDLLWVEVYLFMQVKLFTNKEL